MALEVELQGRGLPLSVPTANDTDRPVQGAHVILLPCWCPQQACFTVRGVLVWNRQSPGSCAEGRSRVAFRTSVSLSLPVSLSMSVSVSLYVSVSISLCNLSLSCGLCDCLCVCLCLSLCVCQSPSLSVSVCLFLSPSIFLCFCVSLLSLSLLVSPLCLSLQVSLSLFVYKALNRSGNRTHTLSFTVMSFTVSIYLDEWPHQRIWIPVMSRNPDPQR